MKRNPRDCDVLGLTDDEAAGLSGFAWRAAQALAHLREAWCVADTGNAAAIEAALVALFVGHSFAENRAIFYRVLSAGLAVDQVNSLLGAISAGLRGDPIAKIAPTMVTDLMDVLDAIDGMVDVDSQGRPNWAGVLREQIERTLSRAGVMR